jgi:hypothetical protein
VGLTGREPYRLLVVEKKWSPDRSEKWLGDLLIQALIEKPEGLLLKSAPDVL